MREGMHKTAITMSKDMWAEVQQVARENGLTANAYMVQAVARAMFQSKMEKEAYKNLSDPVFLGSMFKQFSENKMVESAMNPLLDTIETTGPEKKG